MTQELKNASSYPAIYYAKHMETGLAGYENETILIDGDNLKNMIPSFVSKPVFVHHVDGVELATLKEDAHGYVIESFYNELDGWLWVKMLLTDDIAKQAVANGWSVSNAYLPTEWGAGGTHHNVPYDRKIVNGEFTHLAIVPNPRYEEAAILSPEEYKTYQESKRNRLAELQNSKPDKKGSDMTDAKPLFSFFKKSKQEVKASEIDNDTLVEIKNSKGESEEVTLGAMVAAVLNAKKNESIEEAVKEEGEKVNLSATIRVGDEDMTVGDLMNAYCEMKNTMKNEADKKAAEEAEKEEKENESPEEDGEEELTNSKPDHFNELKNARSNFKPEVKTIELSVDQLARGKSRYSLDK